MARWGKSQRRIDATGPKHIRFGLVAKYCDDFVVFDQLAYVCLGSMEKRCRRTDGSPTQQLHYCANTRT